MDNQDIIFTNQLVHRRTISETINRARRKWKRYHHWFPGEQNRVFSEMERIYKESRAKYGDELFKEYAQKQKLNERMWDWKPPTDLDFSYIHRLKRKETTTANYGRLLPYKRATLECYLKWQPCHSEETIATAKTENKTEKHQGDAKEQKPKP